MREAQISVNNTLITGMYGASKSDAKDEYIYKCYLTYRRRVWWFIYEISTFVYNCMVIIHALK